MRIALPLGAPPVTAYLFYLYPLSILAARDDYLPWLHSHFVQHFQQPGGAIKFYLHPGSISHSVRHAYQTTCPWLDVQSLDQRHSGIQHYGKLPGKYRYLLLFNFFPNREGKLGTCFFPNIGWSNLFPAQYRS